MLRNHFLIYIVLFFSCSNDEYSGQVQNDYVDINQLMIQGIIDNFSDSILKVSTYSSYSDSTFISKADLLRNKRLWQTNLSPQKWTTDFELVHNNSREKYKSLYLKPKKKSEKIKEININFNNSRFDNIFMAKKQNTLITSSSQKITLNRQKLVIQSQFEIKPISKDQITIQFISK